MFAHTHTHCPVILSEIDKKKKEYRRKTEKKHVAAYVIIVKCFEDKSINPFFTSHVYSHGNNEFLLLIIYPISTIHLSTVCTFSLYTMYSMIIFEVDTLLQTHYTFF